MGDIFSLGFGPFRCILLLMFRAFTHDIVGVCTSCEEKDLDITDRIAKDTTNKLSTEEGLPAVLRSQYDDNYMWISQAKSHKLVVGSQV